MSDDLDDAKRSSQSWYWWGIPTLFRCPWNEDPKAADIALVGVPHSSGNGSTERDQHLGPRAVRNVCAWLLQAQPFRPRLCTMGCGANPRSGRRAIARGDEQRGLRARHRVILCPSRRGRHAARFDRRRSFGHRPDPQGARRTGRLSKGARWRSFISMPIPIPTTTCRIGWARDARPRIGPPIRREARRSRSQPSGRHARPSLRGAPPGQGRRLEGRARISRGEDGGIRGARRRRDGE